MLSLIGIEQGRPEVIGIPLSGAAPEPLTKAPEGAFAYEWAPDGKTLAFLTRDPMPRDEERARQDKSFIIRAEAPDRPTRLGLVRTGQLDAATVLVPPSVPPPGLAPMATVMLADELVTVLPNVSCTVTCTAGVIDAPAAVFDGCTVKATLEAAAGLMLNAELLAPVSAPDAAVRV